MRPHGDEDRSAMPALPALVSTTEARRHIAELVLGEDAAAASVGRIALKPHQRAAVVRVEAAMREFGGALLADETGLGKTYVALATARASRHPLIVAPAALRDMWQRASAAAGIHTGFVSMEALSRTGAAEGEGDRDRMPDLVIVDEAHHARNPRTARYRALARLTRNARVLLLSATPLHNTSRDLASLLALFLGARASSLDAAWMGRCIIRRGPDDAPLEHIPRVEPARLLPIDHDERLLDAILALPPPIPPVDGGDGGTLLVYSLLRQWTSSQGALAAALRRRLAKAAAILAGLEAGRHPSADEIGSWAFAEGAVQLAFPELVIADAHAVSPRGPLAACVRDHVSAVRALLDELARGANPDVQRAAHLRDLMAAGEGARIVAFSQYADTVNALFHLLRAQPAVAALTADGARVAGGTITRAEALARFAPNAQGIGPPSRAYRVDLLLTTDLLSEGVNLQDAATVVHLDLPWTPARLEQRVGRVARLGSASASVAVYIMTPPASAERIVRVEQRLRDKLGAATRAVGVVGTIIPSLAPPAELHAMRAEPAACVSDGPAPPRVAEAIRAIISTWRSCDGGSGSTASAGTFPVVAAAAATVSGFLAVLGDAGQPRLLGDVGNGPTDDPVTVLDAVRGIDAARGRERGPADAIDVRERDLAAALNAIARWKCAAGIRVDLSVDGALTARSRRSVADRIAAITRRAPRHLRSMIADLAAGARRTVTARYGIGAEQVLGELAVASMPDEAWLRAVSTFGTLHAGTLRDPTGGGASLPLLALVLLRSVAPGGAEP